jgi:hypothetical protein
MLTDNTLTIAISGTTSTSADMGRIGNPVLFLFPTTTNTEFDIQGSMDNSVFETVYDRFGSTVNLVSASGYIYLEPEAGVALPQYIRLVGDSEEAEERTIKVFSRDLA